MCVCSVEDWLLAVYIDDEATITAMDLYLDTRISNRLFIVPGLRAYILYVCLCVWYTLRRRRLVMTMIW